MKILYVATERGAAEAAARSLHGTARNVTVTWTETPAAALKWIQYNRDADAVIVDADTQSPGCNALLEQIRQRGITTPLAVIAPEHLRGLLLAFNGERDAALADECERTRLLEARLREIEEWRRQAQLLLAEERTGHDAALARTGRVCIALQERLLELEAAARTADQRDAAQVATIERLAGREAELCAEAADAVAARTAVEHQLAEAAAAELQAHQRAAEALAEAGERFAAAENRLTLETAARTTLEDRLSAVEDARQLADQTHATEVAALAAQLAERDAQHNASSARANKICTGLQQRLLELEDAIRAADDRHTVDMAAAETARQHAAVQYATELTSLTTRLADLASQCDAVTVEKTAFERQLRDTAAALEDARRERIAEAAAASERLTVRETELSATLSEATAVRLAVEATLAAAESAHQTARQRWQADLAGAADTLAQRETELADALAAAVAARTVVERQLAEAETERERAQASADAALTAAEARHALDLARLQQEAEDLRRQLDTMRTHAAALRRDLERVPALQRQLEESLHENRRQFERAPYGLCECTRDGAVTRVNHSLARLLGYRSGGELQRIGFDAAVFECADDLHLLLERAVETGKLQSVETLFKTRDSGHLNVRLHALSSGESIVIAVEDLTKLCAVEQRLREAHRMEAVGRVASEVAVTCDTLLRDVTRGGQRWLAGLESDTPLRHQGELLMDDVTRAAGYLRQFVAYGNKAISSLEPVSVPRMLREMEPMLKRVLGSDISLSLPKPARAFEVDVESETVQRIFVNVANYARERMPHGGRMKIDLATTVADQRFLARHPEVRPGAHVLVKITEVQGAIRGLLPVQLSIGRAAPPPFTPPASDKPGMDLGPLMALISDLGGHLWMAAEPGGNLTLEIRIPARITDRETTAPGARGSRSRQIARWFRP